MEQVPGQVTSRTQVGGEVLATLKVAIGWSYDRLSEDERRVFGPVGVR
jgi:hypothetical protein